MSYVFGFYFCLALVSFTQIIDIEAVDNPFSTDPSALVRASSSRIKRLWEARSKSLNPRTKDYPKNKVDLLRRILRNASPNEIETEFERVRTSHVDYARMSDYDQTLLQAFVADAAERKDGSQLVRLLSSKCPRYIGAVPIELYLAIISADNVLILFDSYNQSTAGDTQDSILAILGSVFREVRNENKDEKSFINASKDWYLQNLSKVRVNPYYHLQASGPITGKFFIHK